MEAEATEFYLRNYADSFSAADVDVALASIPQARSGLPHAARGSQPCMPCHRGLPALPVWPAHGTRAQERGLLPWPGHTPRPAPLIRLLSLSSCRLPPCFIWAAGQHVGRREWPRSGPASCQPALALALVCSPRLAARMPPAGAAHRRPWAPGAPRLLACLTD